MHRDNVRVIGSSEPAVPMLAHARHRDEDPRTVLDRPLAATSLLDAVRDLRRDVEDTSFPLELDGVASARASRGKLVDQLTEHLIPRLTELSAPAIVMFVMGSGGEKLKLPRGAPKSAGVPGELVITAKFVGSRRLVERCVITLAGERGLLLVGEPGTAKISRPCSRA